MMFESESLTTFVAITAASAVRYSMLQWTTRNKRREFEPVGKVGELVIYPIKSCKGINVDSAVCTRYGLRHEGYQGVYDRSWVITNKQGKVVSMAMFARCALIQTHLQDGMLSISSPGYETLKVPIELPMDKSKISDIQGGINLHLCGLDCGDEAGAWLDNYFGKEGLRLNVSLPIMPKRQTINMKRDWRHYPLPGDSMSYSNYSGYLMLGRNSIDDLNTRIDNPVTYRNFRPSIVVDGSSAYDENQWEELKIGGVIFRKIDDCSRCFLVNINPDTAKADKAQNPLKTLDKYRGRPGHAHKPIMGAYLAADTTGTIKVGDQVFAKKM